MRHPSLPDFSTNPHASASPHPILIGREREQGALHAWLEATRAGQGRCVLVSGETGIGKTSLADELAAFAEAADAFVLWGHAYDLTVTPPYGPWVELAHRYQPTDDLPPFPAFLYGGDALAAVGSQDALFAQTWDFFATLAASRPLLLILEDLHWADQESLSLLRVVAREVARQHILVLVTYRSDELTRHHPFYQLVPLLVREAQVTRLDLHPLDDTAIRELIAHRYRLAENDTARLETYLGAHAEGNPLYAGELLRTLEADRVLVQQAAGWSLGDLSHLHLPPLLLQVIEGRLGRLSEATRRLLEVAAVIGQEVPLELWQRVSKADEEALAAAIAQGVDAHLLVEGTSGTLHFSHALVREALYQGMVLVRRRVWHRTVGEALAESHSPDPDAVAHHFEEAGDPRAIEWLFQAGERAQLAYAWVTAVERFEAAMAQLTEQEAPAVERALVLYRLAFLLRFSNARQALAKLDEARQLALEGGEPGLAGYLHYFRGLLQCFGGDVRVGLAAMEEGNAVLGSLAKADRSRLHSLMDVDGNEQVGTVVLWMALAGRLKEAASRGAQLLAEAPAPVVRSGEEGSDFADALQGLVIAEALLGRPEAARRAGQQAQATYRAIEDHAEVAGTCGNELELVQLPYFPEQLERRKRLAEEGDAAGRRAIGAGGGIPARSYVLPLLVLEATWIDAQDVAARTYSGPNWGRRLHGGGWLAQLARLQGKAALARQIVAALLPNGPRTEPGDTVLRAALPLQRLGAALALDDGDLALARAWLEANDRWLSWSGAVLGQAEGSLGWAQYHHASGNPRQARTSAEQALAHASDPRQPLALLAVHRFLGILDTEAGQLDAAEEHLRQSLALADACRAPFERALTLLTLAELRLAQRQSEEAGTLLAEVRSICEPLEARPTLARVDTLEQRLTAAQPTQLPRYPAGLTAREVEVLRLLAQGLSNPDIADQLFLSRRTVDTHLSTIYRKLDVTSRIAATRFAIEHGLV